MSLLNFATTTPANMFSCTTSSTRAIDSSKDSSQQMQNMKQSFREDIRKAKTRQILNAKRINNFNSTAPVDNSLISNIANLNEQRTQSLNLFLEAEKAESIDLMRTAIKQMKDLSHEAMCQEHFIEANIILNLCRLLSNETLQVDVCWILSNLTCHESFAIPNEITQELIAFLVLLLQSSKIDSITASFWCLSNLASDEIYAKLILQSNVCSAIHSLLTQSSKHTINHDILLQMTYTIKNLSQECIDSTPPEQVYQLLNVISALFDIQDQVILVNLIESATSILRYAGQLEEQHASIAFYDYFQSTLIPHVLRIISRTDNATFHESLLDFSQQFFAINSPHAVHKVEFMKHLSTILHTCIASKESHLRRKACVITAGVLPIIVNISAELQQNAQTSHDFVCSIFFPLLTSEHSIDLRCIILQGILHSLHHQNPQQHKQQSQLQSPNSFITKHLIEHTAKILKEDHNELILLLTIDILRAILTSNRGNSSVNESIVNLGIVNSLQHLQDHPSDRVYDNTCAIITDFFDFEEEGDDDKCDIEDY